MGAQASGPGGLCFSSLASAGAASAILTLAAASESEKRKSTDLLLERLHRCEPIGFLAQGPGKAGSSLVSFWLMELHLQYAW